jgi:uncharacterized protein GlcG (DUF336 family)
MMKLKRIFAIAAVGLLTAFAADAHAQLADKKAMTLEAAKKAAAAAEAEAAKNKWTVVIAVVDDGGHLVYLSRIDGTQTGSVDVAIRKARTAQAFKRPTKVFEDAIAGGRTALLGLEGIVPLEGGVPIVVGGQLIGAIGVSGVTSQQDGVVAKAGADALAQ